MRELLVKNLVSKDKKRKELFLSEHFEKEGVIQEIEKRTVYRIKAILEFTDISDLELFLNQKSKEDFAEQRYVIKNRSNKSGIYKFIYKILGTQYVVLDDRIIVVFVSQYMKRTLFMKPKNSALLANS
jgi:hypothetical protein